MSSRSKVLSVFKALHRTRENVFMGDDYALKFVRERINEEFRKHQAVRSSEEITNLIKMATESNDLLRKQVMQFKEIRPNVYQMRSDHMQTKCMGTFRETCANCTCK